MDKITDLYGHEWYYKDGVIRTDCDNGMFDSFACSSFEGGVNVLRLFGYINRKEKEDEDT